jgi:APA family basic amino acid/polyamine antiporter
VIPTVQRNADDGLERRLSLSDSVSLVVGAVIGSAIFLVPSTVLAAHPSPLAAVIVFLFAGVLSLFGALAYAELGSMFPETGGEYLYLRNSWGTAAAFLCGWSYFLVTQTGGIAALAVG